MLLTTMGVVIGERVYGENDKFIDIFTKDYGIIEVTVKGGRKLNSINASATALFSYSKFCVNKRGERYYLNSSEIENTFYDLRLDVKKLALASYFAELLKYTVLSYDSDKSYEIILKLFLNTLYSVTGSIAEVGSSTNRNEYSFANSLDTANLCISPPDKTTPSASNSFVNFVSIPLGKCSITFIISVILSAYSARFLSSSAILSLSNRLSKIVNANKR